ncbi:MAG: hypothetical protein ACJAVR_001468 [Paracoccaceae bacterium]|jgi:hypothetical protein
MARINENLIDLSPEAVRGHIAAGRTERSLIAHRALAASLAAGLALLRQLHVPRRPCLTPSVARMAGLNA